MDDAKLLTAAADGMRKAFPEPASAEESKLVDAAIDGMLGSLDPYSAYLNNRNYNAVRDQTRGEFGGIGLQVTKEGDQIKVITPIDGTPAAQAGMRAGDVITHADGHPLTADDFVFMFDDMHMHPEINTWGFRDYWKSIEKVDDHTLRIHFHGPHPEYLLNLLDFRGSGLVSFHPKHYLEKWHINHNPNANEVAKEEGFDDWLRAFEYHYWWHPTTDIDKPTTQPWRFKEFTTTHKLFERNPYYHAVDPANQQLPYFDTVVTEIVQDPELYHVKILSGEADLAFANTSIDNFSLYKQNEEAGGYTVTVIPGINGSEAGYAINVNHPDPGLREVYQDVRFRRALSLAIDRDEINKIAYFGLGVPRAATLNPSTSFYKPEWGEDHPHIHYSRTRRTSCWTRWG